MNNQITEITSDILLHSICLIDNIEELEKHKVYKQNLKHKGSLFKQELIKEVDNIYDNTIDKEQKTHINTLVEFNQSFLQKCLSLNIEERLQLLSTIDSIIEDRSVNDLKQTVKEELNG